ncbi:MAG: MBL fold metallo-hydrolase [Erysipelotrichaceae bacterium]
MEIYNYNNLIVYRLRTKRCNTYLICNEGINYLVDTGTKTDLKVLLECLIELKIKKIDGILLTHAHYDHATNAAYFERLFGCNVYIAEEGINYLLNGYGLLPKGTLSFTKVLSKIASTPLYYFVSHYDKCSNVKDISTLKLNRIEIISTKGHSNDSSTIIIDNKIALCGDTIFNTKKFDYPPYADDTELLNKSIKVILDKNLENYYPGHGRPMNYTTLNNLYIKRK